MLGNFYDVEILTERFPAKTRIHKGLKGNLYNNFFVPLFNLMPKSVVRPWGAHLISKAIK